ncbi:hypothetical protein [Chamaesiphon minutus]|uniref:Uncharacterized protein n=1 Tax=Chamaesiphon minutus (strain ATCC 27169 / PCC 6605) TaxID=1173020 RepID=K9UQD2_CHAP6|nr:hypothetical protein [Chamaesiphon minutus]AFY97015.1 hypothetical protein Cha6605_6185 [Chamaesiphon minutus PCC 6605]
MSSQSPSELLNDEWVQVSQSIAADGLVVRHDIETPDEIATSGASHHFLCLFLDILRTGIT